MKVIVLNDTSNYHYGCKKVIEYLVKDLISNGHEILALIKGNIDQLSYPPAPEHYDQADAIIINGEGTMHHNRPIVFNYLEILKNAKRLGKKTALINTVWQDIKLDQETKEVLRDTYISVREVLSQQELAKDDIQADVHLDLSYFNNVPEQITSHREYVVGKFFLQTDYRPTGIMSLDIFKNDWNSIVNLLRHTDWFITGRHHELYASCKARCPFSALAGNTWKNEGLAKTAGVDILFARSDIKHSEIPRFVDQCKERRMEYEKLFNWMESQPKWTSAVLERQLCQKNIALQ